MIRFYYFGFSFVLFVAGFSAYKIQQGTPIPVLRNAPFVYRGPVFVVQETDDLSEPYVAQIVEGGIEMVQPNLRAFRKPPTSGVHNESFSEIQDDPEHFAVLVTPETVAQAQISRTTTITIPLPILLLGVSSRIPWVMVLKRQNHFDYFRNLTPVHIPLPQRRRSRSGNVPNARLLTGSRKYDLIYTDDDKSMLNSICVGIIQELVYLNAMLQNRLNETEPFDFEPFETVEDKAAEITKSKNTNDGNPTVATSLGDDQSSLEKLFEAISTMNDSTRPSNETANKKQKI